ncbi:acetate kinase [Tabrizicola sp.]|uniref:acetate/propionate family kinase n=1 Tax=Tabrizicola sp. TaxID=2005166 RepID=UPI00286C1F11|nr:acetate kinase [Tabrizicola sp.]
MLLVVNAGSSSVKLAVFDAGLREVARTAVEGVHDHAKALAEGLARAGVAVADLTAAAHRVVHGGGALLAPCRVTDTVLAGIEACVPLAPLHNPANLTGIRAVARLLPDLPQYASFDTAFHATNPEVAVTYALPLAERERGIRRYGFHGLSYAALVRVLAARGPVPQRLLACHLGNGASLCAIRDGRSVATTMGYSPLDGLTMGTRAGAIDGNAVLRLAELHGVAGAAQILNRDSGLVALGGSNDMRRLVPAGLAVAHFIYWAVRHAGSMVAAMGGLDAVVFTGGIGENDHRVRAGMIAGLEYLGAVLDPVANAENAGVLHDPASSVAIWTVPAQEERQIALEATVVMAGEGR